MSMTNSPTLIATMGNSMAGDDAFGPAVAKYLQQRTLTGASLLDVGTKPARLICHLAGHTNLILVDAAQFESGRESGLLEFDYFDPDRPKLLSETTVSTHSFGLADELELAKTLGTLPSRVIVIAAPATMTRVGAPMSPQVRDMVNQAAKRIIELVRDFKARSDADARSLQCNAV